MLRGRVSLMLLSLLAVATACAPAAPSSAPTASSSSPSQPVAVAPPPAAPKRITAAIRGDPKLLFEAANAAAGGSSSAGVREIEQLLNAGLVVADTSGGVRPQLLETVPSLENGLWKLLPDGRMETTHKLRPNARWHDGHSLTTDDLVFSVNVSTDKAVPVAPADALSYIESMEALDAQTLRVMWKSTFVDADKLLSQTPVHRTLPMPKHLLESAYQEDKVNLVSSPYLGPQFVGSGPYKLKEWVLGSHLIMEANDQYVLGRPKIDAIEVKFILDTNTLMSNVLAGAVHMTLGRGLTPEQAITMKEQWKEGKVDAGLQNTTSLYPQFINSDPPALMDARFRRGLLQGLDRQQMVDTFLGGLVPVADSLVSPDEPAFKAIEPQIVKYSFDPRQAMAQFESMGLTRGADGIYQDATGKKMSVEVRTRSHVLREKVQQVIADEWARVGIEGKPVVVPEQSINDRVYQSTFPGFYFRFGDPTQVIEWRSNQAPLPTNNHVGRNTSRYQSPEMDALIDRYVSTIPRDERTNVLGQLMHHHTDQMILLTLYHEPEPVFISNRLLNVGGRRGDALQNWNVQDWELK
jgi:peptide/nickel transport system substrate-binding protein